MGRKKLHRGGIPLVDGDLIEARITVEQHGSISAAAEALGMSPQALRYRYNLALRHGANDEIQNNLSAQEKADIQGKTGIKTDVSGNNMCVDYVGLKIETPDQLLLECNVDLSVWYIDRVSINHWEVAGKLKTGQTEVVEKSEDGSDLIKFKNNPEKLWKQPLRSIKVWLKRKSDDRQAFEQIIEDLKAVSPVVKSYKYPKLSKGKYRRALELTVMDPHLGLHCFPPEADHAWSLDDCENIVMWAIDDLLEQAKVYGPFEEIIFPFGNDFLHHDNYMHTTTRGTPQAEAMPYNTVYKRGIDLAIAMVSRMKEIAPVKVYQIPGNHDAQTSYTLGHVLWAFFHNDANVTVDASSSTYKFHRYGTNLIGYEHGHSIGAIRLAALMANECSGPGPRQGWWDQTSYREFHLGDQHRKGSSKPSTFEEQGVSIEYLPGLTPPNEWHRTKSYNWQKRGAMAFVWDYHKGPRARLQTNLNAYTGAPTGMSVAEVKRLFEPK